MSRPDGFEISDDGSEMKKGTEVTQRSIVTRRSDASNMTGAMCGAFTNK